MSSNIILLMTPDLQYVLFPVSVISLGKGKAIQLQALIGPEGFRRLRLPDFKTIGA
jgi:hypothetical protein